MSAHDHLIQYSLLWWYKGKVSFPTSIWIPSGVSTVHLPNLERLHHVNPSLIDSRSCWARFRKVSLFVISLVQYTGQPNVKGRRPPCLSSIHPSSKPPTFIPYYRCFSALVAWFIALTRRFKNLFISSSCEIVQLYVADSSLTLMPTHLKPPP